MPPCSRTGCSKRGVKKCAGCTAGCRNPPAVYCSVDCQRKDWPDHAEACQKKRAERRAELRGFPLVSDEEWHPLHKKSKAGAECLICLEAGSAFNPKNYTIRAGCACDKNPTTQYHAECLAEAAVHAAQASGKITDPFTKCQTCKCDFGPKVRLALAECCLAHVKSGKRLPAVPANVMAALQISATACDFDKEPLKAVEKMERSYKWAQRNWPDSKVSVQCLAEWASMAAAAADPLSEESVDYLGIVLKQLHTCAHYPDICKDAQLLADIGRASMIIFHKMGRLQHAVVCAEHAADLYSSIQQHEEEALVHIYISEALAGAKSYAGAIEHAKTGLQYFWKTYSHDTHSINLKVPQLIKRYEYQLKVNL